MLLQGGRILDPAAGLDRRADLRIAGGRVHEIGADLVARPGERVVDVGGCLVTPGLIDLHVHFREPGQEARETIASGAAAAAAGGFTTVCAMPNTDPVTDTPERVRRVLDRGRAAGGVRVLPIAAATMGSGGREASDGAALAAAGAVALSDDGLPIRSVEMLTRVLEGARAAGLVVADHCEDLSLSAGGAILEGPIAERLGVRGIPAEAESRAVARDLQVLDKAGGRLHLCHVSTAESVRLLREALARGLAVTAEACPHHLTLTVEAVAERGPLAKMNPPLATDTDREALIEALADGTIGCLATDHAPHTAEEKASGLARAPFGVVGLETAFGVLNTDLVARGRVSLATLIERLTWGPAQAFGLAGGRLDPGAPADVAVFDLDAEWIVAAEDFRSRGRNTPWEGCRLKGRGVMTIVAGKIVFNDLVEGGE